MHNKSYYGGDVHKTTFLVLFWKMIVKSYINCSCTADN